MKALIFSDVHAHPFKYGSTQVEILGFSGTYNSRLADTVKALQEMILYGLNNSITQLWFCGDLFHTKDVLDTEALALVNSVLTTAVSGGMTLHMIPGNHDYADRNGYNHSLSTLYNGDSLYVWDEINLCPVGDNINLIFVPYTDFADKAKAWLKEAGELAARQKAVKPGLKVIMLAHLGVQGSLVGSDYVLVSDKDIDPTDIPCVDFSFFGHYHEHQMITGNSCFVGALTQHNWGDAGGTRGFLEVTIEDDITFKHIETSAPKFIVAKEGTAFTAKKNDFIRYYTTGGNLIVDGEYDHLEIIQVSEDKEHDALEIKAITPMPMVEEWYALKGGDDPVLLAMGRELVAQALQDQ